MLYIVLMVCHYISYLHNPFTVEEKNNGVAIVQLINVWLLILAPTFTETIPSHFWRMFLNPMLSITMSLICLLVAGTR